ncbi:hypothetical protein ACWX0K_16000 [Nitrobacteraceae bacterium UC4446_H13]
MVQTTAQVSFDLTTVICHEPSVSRECGTHAKLKHHADASLTFCWARSHDTERGVGRAAREHRRHELLIHVSQQTSKCERPGANRAFLFSSSSKQSEIIPIETKQQAAL